VKTVITPAGETFSFPDEFTPEQIKAAMDLHFKPKGAVPSFGRMSAGVAPFDKGRALSMLPYAGGMAGGLIGGLAGGPAAPFTAVGGAAAGGELGYATQRLLGGQEPTAVGMVKVGVSQGAQELMGMGLGAGTGRLTRPLIRKVVSFQKAARPSVILNEFGKPFMIEGAEVQFKKRAPKEARHAAEVAMDVASHAMGPAGALVRPVMRGIRGKVASGASGVGTFVNSRRFQMFARQFPRAAAALKQLATYEDQTADTTSAAFRK